MFYRRLVKGTYSKKFKWAIWIAIGFVIAFFSALIVVRWLVGFVSKHGFAPFAWYRIAAGVLTLAVLVAAHG